MKHVTATFKTGPVDPTKPMELDNGTPVKFLKVGGDSVEVRLPSRAPYQRSGEPGIIGPSNSWYYKLESGIWDGGDAEEFFVLRNVAQSAATDSSLPEDDAARNELPMFDGLVAYFPNALAAVAQVSKIGNDQHNPGEPMHWARGKSTDHANKITRHLVDVGRKDARGVRHSARLAWRALALLQEELEREEGAPLARGAKI
jgi:hypothetical protein